MEILSRSQKVHQNNRNWWTFCGVFENLNLKKVWFSAASMEEGGMVFPLSREKYEANAFLQPDAQVCWNMKSVMEIASVVPTRSRHCLIFYSTVTDFARFRG